MFNFEKLDVYKKSIIFNKEILASTLKWPSMYRYSITDQLIRASLSIPLNIAEGSSRTKKDFKRFISVAGGSCYEYIPIIQIASDIKVITGKQYYLWYNQLITIAKMLSGLKSSIKIIK